VALVVAVQMVIAGVAWTMLAGKAPATAASVQ